MRTWVPLGSLSPAAQKLSSLQYEAMVNTSVAPMWEWHPRRRGRWYHDTQPEMTLTQLA
jgi:hypothetical protein